MANLIELDLGDSRTVLVESDEDVTVPRSARGSVGYQKVAPDSMRRTEFSNVIVKCNLSKRHQRLSLDPDE